MGVENRSFALGAAAGAAAGAAVAYYVLTKRRGVARPAARIRHTVLVTLKPDTPDAAVDAMLTALNDMPNHIPSILRLEIGRQIAAVDDGRNASIGGVVEFADEASYKAYAKDPHHVAVLTEFVKPHLAAGGRAALQIAVAAAAADDWAPQKYTGGGGLTRSGRRRICFEMRFDPARLAEYKRHHEHVWREMQAALVRCGWRESFFSGVFFKSRPRPPRARADANANAGTRSSAAPTATRSGSSRRTAARRSRRASPRWTRSRSTPSGSSRCSPSPRTASRRTRPRCRWTTTSTSARTASARGGLRFFFKGGAARLASRAPS
jgi:hypothetical protein